jgi:hypothetical protein
MQSHKAVWTDCLVRTAGEPAPGPGHRPQGISVDAMDLLIGATAIVYDLTVVPHNTQRFQNIPGLRLEEDRPKPAGNGAFSS